MDSSNSNNNPPHSSSSSSSANDSSSNPTNNNRDHFLRHLNKLSHKISKPPTTTTSSTSSHHLKPPHLDPPPPPPPPPPQQQQPPVYNINKNDFRDVVQKLTGSPAHPTTSSAPPPPPSHAPKPASSRLQRIRPPPLVQLTTRPPPLLNSVNPHSPLPPLPTCHAAAESPISAYMRFLHNSTVDSSTSSFNRAAQMMLPPPSLTAANAVDNSGFMWLPSPKSPCPLVFSPTSNGALGFPQLPASPTVSGVPSPK